MLELELEPPKQQASLGLCFEFEDEEPEPGQLNQTKCGLIESVSAPKSQEAVLDPNNIQDGQIIINGDGESELIVGVVIQGKVQCRDSLGKYEQKIGRKLKFEKPERFIIDPKSKKLADM